MEKERREERWHLHYIITCIDACMHEKALLICDNPIMLSDDGSLPSN